MKKKHYSFKNLNFCFQKESMSCSRKVVSINTPLEEICNGRNKAGLMVFNQVVKEFWPNFMHYTVTVEKGKFNNIKVKISFFYQKSTTVIKYVKLLKTYFSYVQPLY